jgi:hypothetical protein
LPVAYRREYGFGGFLGSDGKLSYDSTIVRSELYNGYDTGASIDIPLNAPRDSTSYRIHAHSFDNGAGEKDWVPRSSYIITIVPAHGIVQIIVPGGTGGYQGPINQVFPALGHP